METGTARAASTLGALGTGALMLAVDQTDLVWPLWLWWLAVIFGTLLTAVSVVAWAKVLSDWLSPGWFTSKFGGRRLGPSLMIAFGVYCLAFGGAWYAVESTRHVAKATAESRPAGAPPSLTLETLFRTDFPNANCEIIEDTLNLPIGEQERLLTRFCRVPAPAMFYGGNVFVAFFVPITHYAGVILSHVADNFMALLPTSARDGTIVGGPTSTMEQVNALRANPEAKKYYMWAQPAYIYHAGEIDNETKKRIEERFFKKIGMHLEWRGREYLETIRAKREAENGTR